MKTVKRFKVTIHHNTDLGQLSAELRRAWGMRLVWDANINGIMMERIG